MRNIYSRVKVILFSFIFICVVLACASKNEFGNNPLNHFSIIDENKIIDDVELGVDTIRAALYRNDDKDPEMQFSTAWLQGDTLKILVYEYNQPFISEYLMEVYKNGYRIRYDYDSDEHVRKKIVPLRSLIKLSDLDFKIGSEIKGYTEFDGECFYDNPEYSQSKVCIKGYFKAVILQDQKVELIVNSNYTEEEVIPAF